MVNLRAAYRQAVDTNPPAVLALLRTPLEMRSKVSKRKRKQLPIIPPTIADIVIPLSFQRLEYSNIVQQGQPAVVTFKQFFQTKLVVHGLNNRIETILVFATEEFLLLLLNASMAYADGTFYIAPLHFKQVSYYNSSTL